ncbi:cold shock domain-containing protein [Comamonas sp. JC664]|nr:cold shock domain-containing protein [Comamonas sp. JC664]
MKNAQAATRLTCFGIISAIESDLRIELEAYAADQLENILPEDVRRNALKRWTDHNNSASTPNTNNNTELLDFMDFADLGKILHRITGQLPEDKRSDTKLLAESLLELTPCRNRVCHSRPLEPEDLPQLLDFAKLAQSHTTFAMQGTRETLQRLKDDPTFVLHLTIPEYWTQTDDAAHHNLPLPEFDDTGFLGRTKDRKELTKHLQSQLPVITLVGEGGVGKTALALRCLYDLVELGGNCPYDAVIWISLKTRILTHSGTKEISQTITSVLGLLQEVGQSLGVPNTALSLEDIVSEIIQYMEEFKILLAIDNLETLGHDSLRLLLAAIPRGSKVLLTSRVGLGEFEMRYALDALDENTAIQLARRFAATRNVQSLSHADTEVLRSYCKGLFFNPLLIKWFVASIGAGATPNMLLNQEKPTYAEAIRFCFENLFGRLTETERELLHVMASARRPLSHAELAYATQDVSRDELEWSLNMLHQSSMLRRTFEKVGPHSTTTYALTSIASEYISKFAPPPAETYKHVQEILKSIKALAASEPVRKNIYRHDLTAIAATTRDELICAALLKRAIDEARRESFTNSHKLISQAKEMLPHYSENYRISAVIHSWENDPYAASEEYRLAMEYAPNSTYAMYSYAQFLFATEDASAALPVLEQALVIDPSDPALHTAKALALTRLGRCSDAAVIYEQQLSEISARPKKWRLSTRDQAAECYRRWIEQDIKMSDEAQFQTHLNRALQILSDAFEATDFDSKTVRRLDRVIEEALLRAPLAWRNTVLDIIINCLSTNARHLRKLAFPFNKYSPQIALKPLGSELLLEIAQTPPPASHQSPITLAERPAVLTKKQTSHQDGDTVHGRIKVAPSFEPYGFITDDDGIDWFFHKTFMTNPRELQTLSQGTRVRFVVGRNPKGRCAISVQIADDTAET